MGQIQVKYLNVFYNLTQKKGEVVEFDESLTLKELINRLSQNYKAEFRNTIMDGEEKLTLYAWILVNGEHAGNLEMKLKDGTSVIFSLPIAGG